MKEKSNKTIETVSSVIFEKGEVYITTYESRPGVQKNGIKFLQPHPSVVMVPQQGDHVEVYRLEDGSYIASGAHSPEQGYINGDFSYPDLRQGDILIKPDNQTTFSINRTSSGEYDINIIASGDVNIEGDAVNIGERGQ